MIVEIKHQMIKYRLSCVAREGGASASDGSHPRRLGVCPPDRAGLCGVEPLKLTLRKFNRWNININDDTSFLGNLLCSRDLSMKIRCKLRN